MPVVFDAERSEAISHAARVDGRETGFFAALRMTVEGDGLVIRDHP
jgi:hypothetical protein